MSFRAQRGIPTIPNIFVCVGIPHYVRNDKRKERLETHDVISTIHIDRLASNPSTQIRSQVQRGVANFGSLNIALEWRAFSMSLDHVAQSRNSTCRKSLNRTSGDCIHPYLLWSQIGSKVTYRGFQRSLRHAHHVVSRNDFLRPVVAERDHAST